MFYEITGIQEQNGESINIHFLIEQESPAQVRKILQGHEIIILWIKEALGEETSFGTIQCTIQEGDKQYTIIPQATKIFDAVVEIMSLWFNLINSNFIQNPLEQSKIDAIISDARDQLQTETNQKALEDQVELQTTKHIYQDKKLKKLQEILEEIFTYLTNLYPKIDGVVMPERITRLHQLENDLRKLKMWRNINKIKETLTILFKLLDKIQDKYFEKLEQEGWYGDKIFPETQVIERDLIREYQKLKKSETIKNLDIKANKGDKYYIFFEKNGMFWRFLRKDLFHSIQNINELWSTFFKFLQFVLIVINVELWLYAWTQNIFAWAGDIQHIWIILLYIGVASLVVFALSFFRRKNVWRLILLILIWIVTYIIVTLLIVNNFWL